MLATSRCFDCSTHKYLPHVSSPLSPRSANIYGRYPADSVFMSDAELVKKSQQKQQRSDADKTPYSKRLVKKAPTPGSDELKERRRNEFLKKVRDGREDKRFERRGDDIMRLDFMQRQRQWEAERLREAPTFPSEDVENDEDEYELPSSGNAMLVSALASQALPEDEVDDVLRQEEEEIQALLASIPHDEQTDDMRSEHPWSDDDYDALFAEVVNESVRQEQDGSAQLAEEYGDSMDLS